LDIKNVMVDGLGVGDVGNVVLRDRQHLAEEGIVVAIAEIDQNNFSHLINIELMSRGFVFDKQNTGLIKSAEAKVKQMFEQKVGKVDSDRHARAIISDVLEKYLFAETHRRPMILPVIVNV
jgi:ribonuclease J